MRVEGKGSVYTAYSIHIQLCCNNSQEEGDHEEVGRSREGVSMASPGLREVPPHSASPEEESDELRDLSTELPFPSSVQCYWRVPKVVLYLLEFAIFIIVGLSGWHCNRFSQCTIIY